MSNPWSFDCRQAEVPDPYEGGDATLVVEQYECPNCGWRSGWDIESRVYRDALAHNLAGCDCRLIPRKTMERGS